MQQPRVVKQGDDQDNESCLLYVAMSLPRLCGTLADLTLGKLTLVCSVRGTAWLAGGGRYWRAGRMNKWPILNEPDGKGKGRVELYGGELQLKSVAVKCWNMSGWSVGAREAKVGLKRRVSCQPWSTGICWTKLVERVGSWTNLERMGSWNDLGQDVFTCHGHAWVLRTTSQWKQTSWSKDVLYRLKQFYSIGRSYKALWSNYWKLHCDINNALFEIALWNNYSKLYYEIII